MIDMGPGSGDEPSAAKGQQPATELAASQPRVEPNP